MKNLFSLLTLLLLLTGCRSEIEKGNVPENGLGSELEENIATVIASEKNMPADFLEVGLTGEESSGFSYLLMQAADQKQYKELWKYFQLQADVPNVNFDETSVIFFSLHESGDCPLDLGREDVLADQGTETLVIRISHPSGICSTDATPRTFVFEVDEKASDFKNAKVYESKTETTIPIKNQ